MKRKIPAALLATALALSGIGGWTWWNHTQTANAEALTVRIDSLHDDASMLLAAAQAYALTLTPDVPGGLSERYVQAIGAVLESYHGATGEPDPGELVSGSPTPTASTESTATASTKTVTTDEDADQFEADLNHLRKLTLTQVIPTISILEAGTALDSAAAATATGAHTDLPEHAALTAAVTAVTADLDGVDPVKVRAAKSEVELVAALGSFAESSPTAHGTAEPGAASSAAAATVSPDAVEPACFRATPESPPFCSPPTAATTALAVLVDDTTTLVSATSTFTTAVALADAKAAAQFVLDDAAAVNAEHAAHVDAGIAAEFQARVTALQDALNGIDPAVIAAAQAAVTDYKTSTFDPAVTAWQDEQTRLASKKAADDAAASARRGKSGSETTTAGGGGGNPGAGNTDGGGGNAGGGDNGGENTGGGGAAPEPSGPSFSASEVISTVNSYRAGIGQVQLGSYRDGCVAIASGTAGPNGSQTFGEAFIASHPSVAGKAIPGGNGAISAASYQAAGFGTSVKVTIYSCG